MDGQLALGLVLPQGQTLVSPAITFGKDVALFCELAAGTARVILHEGQEDHELFVIRAGGAARFDLKSLAGRTGRICVRAEDDLTLCKLVIGRQDRLGLLSARANHARRVANEAQHFASTYEHHMFDARAPRGRTGTFEAPPPGGAIRPQRPITVKDLEKLEGAAVQKGDDTYHYAHRVLTEAMRDKAPPFAWRLRALHKDKPVKMLSLCSGSAGIERGILEAAGVPVELTLFDINEKLMGQAAAAVTPFARVYGVVGDVNALSTDQFAHRFDVILFVSSLHHVVELEQVLATVRDLLEENGEFWLVGEQIGRDGNRLWPEAREAADRIFAELPERFRKNVHSGAIDTSLPDNDFSAVTFEGIRSSEIEPLLLRYFEPVQVHRRNCFLWRMVEATYLDNYDLSNEEHKRVVLGLVAAEYNLWRDGGRPTELNAVYRRR